MNTDTNGQEDGCCLIGQPDGCPCGQFTKVGTVPVDVPPTTPQEFTEKAAHRTWSEVKKAMGIPRNLGIEHPGDVCHCGHTRMQHGEYGDHDMACVVWAIPDSELSAYADDCMRFKLDKTALQAAVDQAEEANLSDDANLAEYSESADCITQPGAEQDVLPACTECGHDEQDHEREYGCINVGCRCVVGMAVPEPQLLTDPALKPYRATFAVEGGQAYEIDIPGDFSVMAVDGILKIWTPGRPVLGIVSVRQYPNLPEN